MLCIWYVACDWQYMWPVFGNDDVACNWQCCVACIWQCLVACIWQCLVACDGNVMWPVIGIYVWPVMALRETYMLDNGG